MSRKKHTNPELKEPPKMTVAFIDDEHRRYFERIIDNPYMDNRLLAHCYIQYARRDYSDLISPFIIASMTGAERKEAWEACGNIAPSLVDEFIFLLSIMEDIGSSYPKVRAVHLGYPEIVSDTAFFLVMNALLLLRHGRAALDLEPKSSEGG